MDLTKLSTLELEALIGRIMTQIEALQRDLQTIRGELSRRPPVQIPAPPPAPPEPPPPEKAVDAEETLRRGLSDEWALQKEASDAIKSE